MSKPNGAVARVKAIMNRMKGARWRDVIAACVKAGINENTAKAQRQKLYKLGRGKSRKVRARRPRRGWHPTADRLWIALSTRDQEALLQLMERAERVGEIRLLTAFIRTLLKQSGEPPVVQRERQVAQAAFARFTAKAKQATISPASLPS